MKPSKLSLVVVLLLSFPAMMRAASDISPRNQNPDRIAGRGSRRRQLPTIWDRIHNPRDAFERMILGHGRPAGSTRLHPSTSNARALAHDGIANPIFLVTSPTYDSGGSRGGSVLTGDFNGDGKPDLLVLNQCVSAADCSQGSVGVLLGNGDGTYQTVITSNTGANFGSVTIGDFNRDGKLDVAVNSGCPDLGCTTGSVNILLGNGNGSFQPPVAYASGGNAFSIEAGDLNGDGKLDLVVVTGSTTAGVLLGNGDGTFQSALSVTTSTSGDSAVYLGDFSGDSKLDLAVVTRDCSASPCTRSVSVLVGNGDGSFAPATGTQQTVGVFPNTAGIGDFNGDGKLDLVVIDGCDLASGSCGNDSADVFLGKGDATFQPPVSTMLASSDTVSIAIGDLNADGKLDLAVSPDPLPSSFAMLLLGTGDGSFQTGKIYQLADDSTVGAITDLNSDGEADMAVANACIDADCTQGAAQILLATGPASFALPVNYFSAGPELQSLAVSDFNGDGQPDIAELSLDLNSTSLPSSVNILLGKADGTFTPEANYALGTGSLEPFFTTPLVTADFNGDGKSDLAAPTCVDSQCSSTQLAVLLGNGDGTFQSPVVSPSVFTFSMAAGDLNGDGKVDLVLAETCTDPDCNTGAVNVQLGNGDGSFQSPVSYLSGGFKADSVAIGDFNHDGIPDLVLANDNCGERNCPMGSLSVLLGNGDGTFQPAVTFSSGDFGAYAVAVADFNGDGKLDLAVSNIGSCFVLPCGSGSVGILLGKGDGSFQAAVTFSSGPQLFSGASDARSIVVADFDGDGKLDIGLSNRSVLLGNGDGTFQDAQSYNLGTDAGVSAVAADFNGDGKPDLAVDTAQFLTVLLNVSTGFQHATSTALASSRNPVDLHHHVTFTATVTSSSTGMPTGSVTFSDHGKALDTESISNGKAAFSTSSLDAGVHSITASYSGDQAFLPSTSAELKERVRADTRTKLTSSNNPSKKREPVTFTAVVVADSGGTPRGKVTFKDSYTVLATVHLSNGQATFTTSRLHRGRHVIHAEYGGDSTDRCSSTALTQTVR